jgi:nucleotide-binding universal stress UspA family protein
LPFPYKQILCPVDFDQNSAHALSEAAALALNGGGKLLVLHVVQINPLVYQGAAEGVAGGEMLEAQLEFARQQVEQMLAEIPQKMKRTVIVEVGEPGERILDTERKFDADLVVMATHGRRGIKHLVLGSVAERIVRESSVPVLTIRPRNPSE